jgi:hypothetical protein
MAGPLPQHADLAHPGRERGSITDQDPAAVGVCPGDDGWHGPLALRPGGLQWRQHALEDPAATARRASNASAAPRPGPRPRTPTCTKRASSATPLSGRQLRARTSATLTGSVRTRSRQPRRLNSLKVLRATG